VHCTAFGANECSTTSMHSCMNSRPPWIVAQTASHVPLLSLRLRAQVRRPRVHMCVRALLAASNCIDADGHYRCAHAAKFECTCAFMGVDHSRVSHVKSKIDSFDTICTCQFSIEQKSIISNDINRAGQLRRLTFLERRFDLRV
jgi:hypothetical protein